MAEFAPFLDARTDDEPPVVGIEKHHTPQPRSTYVDFALSADDYGWIVISELGVRSVAFGTVEVTDQELGQYLRHAVTAWQAAFEDVETAPGLQFDLDTAPLQDRPRLDGFEVEDSGYRTRFTFRTPDGDAAVVVSEAGVDPDANASAVMVRHAVTAWRVRHREFRTPL